MSEKLKQGMGTPEGFEELQKSLTIERWTATGDTSASAWWDRNEEMTEEEKKQRVEEGKPSLKFGIIVDAKKHGIIIDLSDVDQETARLLGEAVILKHHHYVSHIYEDPNTRNEKEGRVVIYARSQMGRVIGTEGKYVNNWQEVFWPGKEVDIVEDPLVEFEALSEDLYSEAIIGRHGEVENLDENTDLIELINQIYFEITADDRNDRRSWSDVLEQSKKLSKDAELISGGAVNDLKIIQQLMILQPQLSSADFLEEFGANDSGSEQQRKYRYLAKLMKNKKEKRYTSKTLKALTKQIKELREGELYVCSRAIYDAGVGRVPDPELQEDRFYKYLDDVNDALIINLEAAVSEIKEFLRGAESLSDEKLDLLISRISEEMSKVGVSFVPMENREQFKADPFGKNNMAKALKEVLESNDFSSDLELRLVLSKTIGLELTKEERLEAATGTDEKRKIYDALETMVSSKLEVSNSYHKKMHRNPYSSNLKKPGSDSLSQLIEKSKNPDSKEIALSILEKIEGKFIKDPKSSKFLKESDPVKAQKFLKQSGPLWHEVLRIVEEITPSLE